ncbi:hypothetical protein F5Y14DRAFT_201238 [Nemania sp. NC0429]|nr:hypothetical protein F5Y14DRAFT_201238 [Nemania sp. NC0429]
MPLAVVPSTSLPMEAIYTSPAASLAAGASGSQAILRRTHSIGSQQLRNEAGEIYARDGTHSPVRANSKRRRSVASNFCPMIGARHASEFSYSSLCSSPRSGSVELGSDNYRSDLYRAVSSTSRQSRPRSGRGRSPSRGRARRRNDVSHHSHPRQDKGCENGTRSNISRPRQHNPVELHTSERQNYSSRPHPDKSANSETSYITKGVFRLYNYREPGEFRPLKSSSRPKPTWRAGDGFSDDEVAPGFTFITTCRHKRKRSRSLSAFGQLSLEAGIVAENGKLGATSSQQYWLGGRQRNVRRKIAKDLWPTRDNFTEDLDMEKPGTVEIDDNSIVQPSPSFHPTSIPSSGPEMKQAGLRKRRASDFENFRNKRRLQSRRSTDKSFIFTTASPEYRYQVYRYQVSDDGYNEEEGRFCGQARDESERDQQSVTGQPVQYIPETTGDFEGSDIDSEKLSEYDGMDLMIQNIVKDSQPDEVSERKSHEEVMGTAQAVLALITHSQAETEHWDL